MIQEVFQLTVAAFENLSHVSGRCYTKAVSILDNVARVRSCLVMLDLECDELIIQMFRHFLKTIRWESWMVIVTSVGLISVNATFGCLIVSLIESIHMQCKQSFLNWSSIFYFSYQPKMPQVLLMEKKVQFYYALISTRCCPFDSMNSFEWWNFVK